MYCIKISDKTLHLVILKLIRSHGSKQTINLHLGNIEKKISDKFKHSDNGSKYLIGYTDENIITPLHLILSQMSENKKYFDDG